MNGTFANSSAEASPGFKVLSAECMNSTGAYSTASVRASIKKDWLNLTAECGSNVIATWTTQSNTQNCQNQYGYQQCTNATTTTTHRLFVGTISIQYSNSTGGTGNLEIATLNISHVGT